MSKAALSLFALSISSSYTLFLPAFSFTSKKSLNLIRNKQKQCIKITHKAKYNAHTEPLFYKAQILPLDDLILQQKITFMHSLMYKYAPVSYQDFYPNREANIHIT